MDFTLREDMTPMKNKMATYNASTTILITNGSENMDESLLLEAAR